MREVLGKIADDSAYVRRRNRYVHVVLIADDEAQMMVRLTEYLLKYNDDSSKEIGLYIGKSCRNGPSDYHERPDQCGSSILSKLASPGSGKSCFIIKIFKFGSDNVSNIKNADKCEAFLQVKEVT